MQCPQGGFPSSTHSFLPASICSALHGTQHSLSCRRPFAARWPVKTARRACAPHVVCGRLSSAPPSALFRSAQPAAITGSSSARRASARASTDASPAAMSPAWRDGHRAASCLTSEQAMILYYRYLSTLRALSKVTGAAAEMASSRLSNRCFARAVVSLRVPSGPPRVCQATPCAGRRS